MSFFKKLFGKKDEPQKNEPPVQAIYTEDHFKERYTEQYIKDNAQLLDGSLKMIESYFMDNKITREIETPINHPINLDQVLNDGLGFHMYCQAFQLEDSQTVMFLALSFSEFLITTYGLKLYRDNQPEQPLRSMTLKYDREQVVLSLYPFEYALKALNNEAAFEDLHIKVKTVIEKMPGAEEMIKKFLDGK